MDRINGLGTVLNAAGKRVFVDENLLGAIDGTDVEAVWLTGVQEEMLAVIEGAGIAADLNNNTQLRAAINDMITTAALGFVPVQQGGGNLQNAAHKIYIGWDPADQYVRLQVDGNDQGRLVFDGYLTSKGFATTAGAAADAQTRADNAQAAAQAAAALDAQNRANSALATAEASAASDAQNRANVAQANAEAYANQTSVALAGAAMPGPLHNFDQITVGPTNGNTNPCGSAVTGVSLVDGRVNSYTGDGAAADFGIAGAANVVNIFCSGNQVGAIYTNGSSTSFATSSDYRLKQNVTLMGGALARVNGLPVHRFNFAATPSQTVDGFLAHEAAIVVPEAVIGVKDATRTAQNVVLNSAGALIAEGVAEADFTAKQASYGAGAAWQASVTLPVYQTIDQSKLVPVLWAALQELSAKVDSLMAAKAA